MHIESKLTGVGGERNIKDRKRKKGKTKTLKLIFQKYYPTTQRVVLYVEHVATGVWIPD